VKRTRVVVTRPTDTSDRLTERLKSLGCEVVSAAAIEIGPPRSYESLDRLVHASSRFDWILFMSRNAVRFYVQRVRRFRRGGSSMPPGVRVGVVGPGTEAIAARAGITVDLRSLEHSGKSLANDVSAIAKQGSAVLVVQAEDGRTELLERLRTAGFRVECVAAYRTRPAVVPKDVVEAVRTGAIDAVAFASPSSAISYAIALGGLGEIPSSVVVAAVGPTTAAACTRAGRAPDVVAGLPSAEALADAIVSRLERGMGVPI
jgi:uroporphyrinogen-III synthase